MQFNIHGDNIVECERTLSLVIQALDGKVVNEHGPFDSAVCPLFQVEIPSRGLSLAFRYFPGFGRWSEDILALVRERGGLLREAADAIITRVESASEEPMIAIEYCGALPAGNQAWQRNGRAYSFARARIPYVYITEAGGYELDADRSRKSTRLPNPAVPFSYLSLSASRDTLVAQVIVANPGADAATMQLYKDVFGYDTFLSLIRHLILGERYKEDEKALEDNLLDFVKLLAAGRKRKDSITPEQWMEAYQFISTGGMLHHYVAQRAPLPWAKMAYIEALTVSARKLMDFASKYAVGLTSSTLPMCVIPPSKYRLFVADVCNLYPDLPSNFVEWLSTREELTICWVMGFKPRGDDARPDRGLAPMARMLIGDGNDLLTVVYGPAPNTAWPVLENDPAGLMKLNGLWEAILAVSDAVLIDSRTATSLHKRAFLKSHWQAGIAEGRSLPILVPPTPIRIGEHDVDTVLHQLFSRLAGDRVFEGMCNPPGGDWSGVSLLTPDKLLELRWLSLPRVTPEIAKRPDHLFEVFGIYEVPVALVVESKERSDQVEMSIGPRLVRYATDLISTMPSIRRQTPAGRWNHATTLLTTNSVQFVSAVAFVADPRADLNQIAQRARTDIVFSLEFTNGGGSCTIHAYVESDLGRKLIDFVQSILPTGGSIRFSKD
jgi:hypothetical protein